MTVREFPAVDTLKLQHLLSVLASNLVEDILCNPADGQAIFHEAFQIDEKVGSVLSSAPAATSLKAEAPTPWSCKHSPGTHKLQRTKLGVSPRNMK